MSRPIQHRGIMALFATALTAAHNQIQILTRPSLNSRSQAFSLRFAVLCSALEWSQSAHNPGYASAMFDSTNGWDICVARFVLLKLVIMSPLNITARRYDQESALATQTN